MKSGTACKLCFSTDSILYCHKSSMEVLKCCNCHLIFTPLSKGIKEIENHYSKQYFDPYLDSQAVHLEKRFGERLQELKRIKFPGLLLDVGCGIGIFLKAAHDAGYDTVGLEISQYAIEYARKKYGLDVLNCDLENSKLSQKKFDVITLWHVLEHVTDPVEFLAKIKNLLKKDGILAIEVPNIGSFAAKISGLNWEMMAPDEHFSFFTMETLTRLLEEKS